MSNAAKKIDILATNLSVLHNYFDSSIKLKFFVYPAKILDLFSKTILSVQSLYLFLQF